MKIKPSWQEKSCEFDGAVIKYRLPGYSVIAEFMQKFGVSASEDGPISGMLDLPTDMLVWMITGWTGVETATEPPKAIEFTQKNLRDVLDYDMGFKETLLEKTNILEHLAIVRIGYGRKVEKEKENLWLFTRLMWLLRCQKKGTDIHAVKMNGKIYRRSAIQLMPGNFEAVRIFTMIDSLHSDFFTTLEHYEGLMQETYDVDRRYVIQEKVTYIKNLIFEFDQEELRGT